MYLGLKFEGPPSLSTDCSLGGVLGGERKGRLLPKLTVGISTKANCHDAPFNYYRNFKPINLLKLKVNL